MATYIWVDIGSGNGLLPAATFWDIVGHFEKIKKEINKIIKNEIIDIPKDLEENICSTVAW